MTTDRQFAKACSRYFKRASLRLSLSFFNILVASIAVGISITIAIFVFHHPFPFLAATSAWIALGFTDERRMRRVVELAVGVTIGVAFGEVLIHLIGIGLWQVPLILFVTACLARFLDGGRTLVTQAGVQCMYIALVPQVQGGIFARVTDTLIGAIVAITIALIVARDPRKAQRLTAHKFFVEMSEILTTLALACREGSRPLAATALARARRSSQTLTNNWADANSTADEVSKFALFARRHGREVHRLEQSLEGADKAMRNLRVIARRTTDMLDSADLENRIDSSPTSAVGTNESSNDESQRITFGKLSEVLQNLSDAVTDLDEALAKGQDPATVRPALVDIAKTLQPVLLVPHVKVPGHNPLIHGGVEITNTQGIAIPPMTVWHGQTLVLLLRSVVVDLFEATGYSNAEARAQLSGLIRV